MYVKREGELNEGDWEGQKEAEDVGNAGCRRVEFRGRMIG